MNSNKNKLILGFVFAQNAFLFSAALNPQYDYLAKEEMTADIVSS
jgi:hypothetical protein